MDFSPETGVGSFDSCLLVWGTCPRKSRSVTSCVRGGPSSYDCSWHVRFKLVCRLLTPIFQEVPAIVLLRFSLFDRQCAGVVRVGQIPRPGSGTPVLEKRTPLGARTRSHRSRATNFGTVVFLWWCSTTMSLRRTVEFTERIAHHMSSRFIHVPFCCPNIMTVRSYP